MVAHKLDFGAMADFPSVLNGVAFKKQGERSVYLAPAFEQPHRWRQRPAGSPSIRPCRSLRDLKGKQISVPFGSAAHGMLLRAIHDLGWNPDTDVGDHVPGPRGRRHLPQEPERSTPTRTSFPSPSCSRSAASRARSSTASTVGVPTSHGLLVTGAFADKYPEVVVAFIKASLEADRLVSRRARRSTASSSRRSPASRPR